MELLIWALVFGSAVWVGMDASRLGAHRGRLGGGFLDMGPVAWFLVVWLFWIIGMPCYLATRGRLVEAQRRAQTFWPQQGGYPGQPYPPGPYVPPGSYGGGAQPWGAPAPPQHYQPYPPQPVAYYPPSYQQSYPPNAPGAFPPPQGQPMPAPPQAAPPVQPSYESGAAYQAEPEYQNQAPRVIYPPPKE
ncbi:hypothetical protein LWF15_07950 [Kineosporia rhizophila]|uniref:hypothetical protein n=1 Tax=Kineosporia rhizophila TaxID=84633 RepID=UPI001E5C6548|nr:hypothetical protein [Kineosporia rhizophila]MCE0535438.1 hypothetical protein [Kineosporia rhizophila]